MKGLKISRTSLESCLKNSHKRAVEVWENSTAAVAEIEKVEEFYFCIDNFAINGILSNF
jgi:hypothetical protein